MLLFVFTYVKGGRGGGDLDVLVGTTVAGADDDEEEGCLLLLLRDFSYVRFKNINISCCFDIIHTVID